MIGDDENPGTPAAAPPPHAEPPAAPEPATPVNEAPGTSEGGAALDATDATQMADASRTLHLAGDPHRRRRRRRRRHGPKPEGAAPDAPATSGTAHEAAPTEAAVEGDKPIVQRPPRRLRVEAIAAGGEFILAALPASDRPRRRRRRRRGARPEGAAPLGGEAVAAASGGEGAQQQQQRRERGPRRRGPRDQREGDQRGGDRRDGNRQRGDGAGRDDQRRDDQRRDGQGRDGQGLGERREGQPRDGERRDGERRDRGPRPGKGGKPFGKGGDRDRGGRDGRRDKPAPKLYSFESVVDRGFEDVAAPPTEGEAPAEGGTRRVDWTIVKRTVADQRVAKTVSAQYILKRDGAETEFPNLGAARAAVNKTIVHPEKLTRAKADYPTTKK
jgi:hypothetical protein